MFRKKKRNYGKLQQNPKLRAKKVILRHEDMVQETHLEKKRAAMTKGPFRLAPLKISIKEERLLPRKVCITIKKYKHQANMFNYVMFQRQFIHLTKRVPMWKLEREGKVTKQERHLKIRTTMKVVVVVVIRYRCWAKYFRISQFYVRFKTIELK